MDINNLKSIIYTILVASQIIFCLISYFPQIVKLIKTKKSDDISIQTWILLSFSFIDYALILIMNHANIILQILNAFELLLCMITTALVIFFHQKK